MTGRSHVDGNHISGYKYAIVCPTDQMTEDVNFKDELDRLSQLCGEDLSDVYTEQRG